MLIVTCVKQVPDTTQVRIDPEKGTLIRDGVPSIINPFDTHALEASLCLKDAYGFKVVAISMGPPAAEITLRKALAMGADDAILLSDRAFGGADTLATSKLLAEAVKRLSASEEVGLVICGKQTIDGDTAQVGPGIATRLQYNQLTSIDKVLDVDMPHRKIKVRRKLEGRYEIIETSFPAMIAVLREINEPRYPTVPGRLIANDIPVTVWDNKIMQLDEATIGLRGSATQVRKIFSPQRAKSQLIGTKNTPPAELADLLIDKLLATNFLCSA